MALTLRDALPEFTQDAIGVYNERNTPSSFLSSMFVKKAYASKNVSLMVRRGNREVAVDVQRGTEGNMNVFAKETQRVYTPPLYNEMFGINELDVYDTLLSSADNISTSLYERFVYSAADKAEAILNKIKRAEERQCAQVLQTGIVTLNNGDNIDFKRKGTSIVDISGSNPWDGSGNNPIDNIITGMEFLRKEGKMSGNRAILILGDDAVTAFVNNSEIQDSADVRRLDRGFITQPELFGTGYVSHGAYSAGNYTFEILGYSDSYELSGVDTKYIDAKNAILVPADIMSQGTANPIFEMSYGLVPQLPSENGGQVIAEEYHWNEWRDPRGKNHFVEVESAPLAIPKVVDMIYTMQVLA